MARRKRAAILPSNIALLQNLVKRDPESYREEFEQQYSHYESLRDIFMLSPSSDEGEEFAELVGFVSAVCNLFPKDTTTFPEEIATILTKNFEELTPDLREKIIQCLVLLRNKGVISPEFLLNTLFPLLFSYNTGEVGGFHSKETRKQVYSALISMLKACNTGTKNQKLNRATQALLFNLLDQKDNNGLWATKLTRELWKRGIWDDSRTVEIMTQACLHPDTKVVISGVRFFLGADKEREEALEEDEEEDDINVKEMEHRMKIKKKNTKKARKLKNEIHQANKKNSQQKQATSFLNFSAIHLLRDPQQFAEQMFKQDLSGKNSNRFTMDQRIAIMILVSRLVGTHKLSVLGLYSFFLKYLNPKQNNVTHILAAAAQASHDLVPPETINTVVRKIADEFVSEGVASEVAATGINAIREILARNPAGVDATLLQDLTAYKGSKAKSVVSAARSLIALYREAAPEMLAKKDRGKVAQLGIIHGDGKEQLKFGEETGVTKGIPGIEKLIEWKKQQGLLGNEDEDGWSGEEEEDLAADIEGDWVDVKDGEDIDIDLEDDEPQAHHGIKKKYLKYMQQGKKRKQREAEEEEDSDLELSDDETDRKKAKTDTAAADKAMQELLAGDVMTPADFEKLKELNESSGNSGKKLTNEDTIEGDSLMGYERHKMTREEKLASVMEGREGREKYGSAKGKIEGPHSTTNKQKARKKNFIMAVHKRTVQGKKKVGLGDRQKLLRAQADRKRRGGRRGNYSK